MVQTQPYSQTENQNSDPQASAVQTEIITEKIIDKTTGATKQRQYIKSRLLGKGGFAKCYELTSQDTKQIYAAKITLKSNLLRPKQRVKMLSEIKIHRALRHDNILQFEHVFEDKDCVYMLLELCHNQTLNELVKRRHRLHPLEVQCYTLQILKALQYLHERRYIHRDLKLGNLFLAKDMTLKLGDFGLAAHLEENEEKKKTVCGTPNYIAPEILSNSSGYSYEVDIWSLGIVIYALLLGRPPFETSDVKATYRRIKTLKYSYPEGIPIPDSARNLIDSLLKLDPHERLSLEEIMSHQFMTGNSIPALLTIATLAAPPTKSFINTYMKSEQFPSNYTNSQNLAGTHVDLQEKQQNRVVNPLMASDYESQKIITKNLLANAGGNVKSNKDDLISGTVQPLSPLKQRVPASQPKIGNALELNQNNAVNAKIIALQQTGTQNSIPNQISADTTSILEPRIIQWVDYSSKYGVAYILSNSTCGVYFNDSTKIILSSSGLFFEYMDRQTGDQADNIQKHSINDYPQALNKKVTLLLYFQDYLQNNQNVSPGPKINVISSSESNLVYVKKWLNAKRATIFRLSNKVIQVKFSDETEILLSSEKKLVAYINKQGEGQIFPLSSALSDNQNQEMSKRLRYTKEILTSLFAYQGATKQETS